MKPHETIVKEVYRLKAAVNLQGNHRNEHFTQFHEIRIQKKNK